MKTRLSLRLVLVLLALAVPFKAQERGTVPAHSRTFSLTYQVTLKDLPAGAARVAVWIPRPVTDSHQIVVLKKIDSTFHLGETHENRFGNHMLYGEILHPQGGTTEFAVEYEVTRKEFSQGAYADLARKDAGPSPLPKNLAQFLQPDQLVPIDGKIKELADENTRGKLGTIEKAHALYDYVFQTVRYDKSGTGWGRGDSLWVCDARHGNCTDFHSLFISLARAEGIPAKFEIGLPVPNTAEGTIPGYHCWAEFFVNGLGWIPVDISEAWKDPKLHDYFFGSVDSNRVQFSVGRDLTLNPKQKGKPLNYFVYPYAEVDGKPFEGIGKRFSFRVVSAPSGEGAKGK